MTHAHDDQFPLRPLPRQAPVAVSAAIGHALTDVTRTRTTAQYARHTTVFMYYLPDQDHLRTDLTTIVTFVSSHRIANKTHFKHLSIDDII